MELNQANEVVDIYDQIPSDSSPEKQVNESFEKAVSSEQSGNSPPIPTKKPGKGKGHQGWNDQNNRLAIVWMLRCAFMEKSLYKRFKRLSVIWAFILFIQIVINAIASGLAILNLGGKQSIYERYGVSVDALLAILNIMATILAAITASVKFPKIMETLRYAITKFSKLIRTIERIVNTSPSRRPDAEEFLDAINEKYYKYHNSGKYLVEEMMNFHNMKQKVQQANSFNKIDISSLAELLSKHEMDQDDDLSNSWGKRLGLLSKIQNDKSNDQNGSNQQQKPQKDMSHEKDISHENDSFPSSTVHSTSKNHSTNNNVSSLENDQMKHENAKDDIQDKNVTIIVK